MKLTILAENLQKKLTLATHAISSRSQLPILSHVLLETKDGNLCISATDLEIGIEVKIPAEIEEQGSITVPAKLFSELVGTLPQDKITLETKEGTLEIKGKRVHSVLQTTPSDEFPNLYEEFGQELVVFQKGELKSVFGKIVFAASVEATRPALAGVLIRSLPEGFVVVATDGYRLSLDHFSVPNSTNTSSSIIVPAKVIKEAMGLREEEPTTLHISSHNNQVAFVQKDAILIGRIIEAEFPNYQKIIPTDAATKVTFDKEEMLKAVKACSIFARETANIIKLSIHKENIIVSAKTPSLGENTVEVESRLDGEENDIAFNARYILDCLSNMPDGEITFEMTGPLNAGVFKVPSNPQFLHLIMPIRTQG